MKKLLKGLLAVVVVIVLAIVAVLAAHPLWVGPLVKSVAESIGPKYTGTPLVVESCGVNLYSGHFELTGFALSNPAGCPEDTAAGVGTLKVDLDTLSALTDLVNIRSIEVSGVFASYVKGASGKYNFTEIAENAKKASGGETAEKPAEEAPKAEPQSAAETDGKKESAGKKVVIERLSVGDVKVAAFGVKFPLLPGTIVLTDIGKKSNGATMSEAWDQVREQILKSSGAVGKQFSTMMELGSEYGQKGLEYGQKGIDLGKKGLDAGTEGAKKALDAAKNLDVEGAKDAIKGAGQSLKEAGQGLKDVGKGLKGLFGD